MGPAQELTALKIAEANAAADVELPNDEPMEPRLLSDPFGWYAMHSHRRPRVLFFGAWLIILVLCAAGLPQFSMTEDTDYDWLLVSSIINTHSSLPPSSRHLQFLPM
jgi:hypothetical protein